jgi:hypothetical protein
MSQLPPAGWLTGSWRVSKTFPNVPSNGLVAIHALPLIRERGDLAARAVAPALSTSLPSIPIPASTTNNLPSPQPKQSASVAFSGTQDRRNRDQAGPVEEWQQHKIYPCAGDCACLQRSKILYRIWFMCRTQRSIVAIRQASAGPGRW